jgi:ribonuclease III
MTVRPISEIMDILGYSFGRVRFLEEALCHSSYVNEQPQVSESNERLEFLGDAVLNLSISHLLMTSRPDLPEGQLSRMRAGLVNEQRLAEIAETINLGGFLRLGRGERRSEGHRKTSILADAMEAVIAAVYMDGGYGPALDLVRRLFAPLMETVPDAAQASDYKTRLQELVQKSGGGPPEYRLLGAEGPDHEKTFRVSVEFQDLQATGIGKSKKAAEQNAAHQALAIITTSS